MIWWTKSVMSVVVLAAVLGAGVYLILGNKDNNLVSPVAGGQASVAGENLWLPLVDRENYRDSIGLEVSAKAAFFLELESGKMLYGKNVFGTMPVASLAKIMTAIVALENLGWDEKLLVSETSAAVEPDEMVLLPGEIMAVSELMQGMFLVSANDAAELLAEKTFGNRDKFLEVMNKKALQLGMRETYFINPTGLEEDPSTHSTSSGQAGSGQVAQYSSAYDVVLMSRYLINRFPQVLDITRQYHVVLPATSMHRDYEMYSGINLLTTYPGVVGLKTGFTPEAGLTLVTVVKKEGHTVMGVLLGSENRREDAKTLLDFSFEKLGVR